MQTSGDRTASAATALGNSPETTRGKRRDTSSSVHSCGSSRDHAVRNVTGVDSPYEPPEHAELRVETVGRDAQAVADDVLAELRRRGIVRA